MKINITHYHFEEIVKAGYTLDMIYFLKLADEGIDVASMCSDTKMNTLCQTVRRKGLLSESFQVTLLGKCIIGFLDEEGKPNMKLNKTPPEYQGFEKWWLAYPGTDTFTHRDQKFTGTRAMRVRKDDCKAKFIAVLAEGEYKVSEMIAALEYEVLQKKENSVKTKTNRLTFMQNSLTYLNQRSFEPFIELVKEGKTVIEEPIIRGGTDI